MVYRKPYLKLPPSRVTLLDRNPRALYMFFFHTGFYGPMGMRSKARFQRVLKYRESIALRTNNQDIHYLMDPERPIPLKSVHETIFPAFLKLAKWKGFSVYAKLPGQPARLLTFPAIANQFEA